MQKVSLLQTMSFGSAGLTQRLAGCWYGHENFPGLATLLLDFEDPEDMLAKQRLAAEELTRRAKLAMQDQGTQPPAARTASGDPGKVVE